jgi:hypothetical protein
MTPTFTPFFSKTTEFFKFSDFIDGSLLVSILAARTGKFILFKNFPRFSGPSSNSWFPREMASGFRMSRKAAVMLSL